VKGERAAITIALTSAALRLLPLQWLHPLNWDEIEFYRATRWIAEGRVPFRDFWEHHSPLAWFVFAPFSRLSDTPGAAAILGMRWAQIPVWIATFWLANVFMRNAGLTRCARWCAMAIALCSSFLMIAAVEYRKHWFWIDDRDLYSKRALALLMLLFTLADTGAKESLPLITIPAQ